MKSPATGRTSFNTWNRPGRSYLSFMAVLGTAFLGLAFVLSSPDSARASLIAFYDFNDGTATDQTGNGHNGTVSGATWTAGGFQGGAFQFNVAGDHIDLALNLNPHAKFTMGAWVNPDEDAPDPAPKAISIDNGLWDPTIGLDPRVGTGGPSVPMAYAGFRGSPGVLNSGVLPSYGQWTFLAAVYDGPGGTVDLYVDNQLFSSSYVQGSGTVTTWIGGNPTFGHYWKGLIDNAFFYDEALTQGQITALRLNGSPVPEPSSFVLMGVGLAGLAGFGWRRKRSAA